MRHKKPCPSRIFLLLLTIAAVLCLSACGDGSLPATSDTDVERETYTDGETLLVKTYKNNRYKAVKYYVTANGAKGDGVTDDTLAIQTTLDKAAKGGGGTVYLPEGKYRVSSQINVPANVTLLGDFAPPTLKGSAAEGGTVIICQETQATLSDPLIKLNDNSAVSDLTVWYEGQSYTEIKEYPYTVIQDDGEKARVSNVALLNSFNGIKFASSGGKKLTVENVYITAFGTGFNIVRCTDRVILENINLSPIYWLNSPLTPKGEDFSSDLITEKMRESLCAISIGIVSDASIYGVNIDTAKTGMVFDIPSAMDGSAVISKVSVTNAEQAVTVKSAGRYGIAFACCSFRTTDLLGSCAVKTEAGFTTSAVFNSCTFPGQPFETVVTEGKGKVSFMNCKFTAWRSLALNILEGTVSATANDFLSTNSVGIFGPSALGVLCNNYVTENNYIAGTAFITQSENEYADVSIDPAWLATSDSIPTVTDRIYYASEYGVDPKSPDNTAALQELIDTVSKQGGIIFLTEGEYTVKGNIDLKSNVRLCGVSDKATTLLTPMAFTDKIFITMGDGASLFDLGIAFVGEPISTATDDVVELIPTSYIITTKKGAKNVHIEGVTLINAPNGIYLDTAVSPTVKNVTGTAFFYGVFVKDCTSPLLKSVTFDTTYASEGAKLYQQEHFVGFAVNGGKDVKILNCYVDNADYGVLVNSSDALESVDPMIVVNALLSKNCYAGFCIEKSTTSVFVNTIAYCAVFEKNAYHGSTLSTSRGQTYVYNMICGGKATASLIVRGDSEVFVQTSIFNGDLTNTVRMLGGYVEAVGNIMAAKPAEYHLYADNGAAIFMGNLVNTTRAYAGLEDKYLRKSVSDRVIFVDYYNMRDYAPSSPTE